jgi:hypothetical protein
LTTLTIDARLPADLDQEATAVASGDYLTVQKSGEDFLRKLQPSALGLDSLALLYAYNGAYSFKSRAGNTGAFTGSVWNIDYQGWDATYGMKFRLWGWDSAAGYLRTTDHFYAGTPEALGVTPAAGSSQFMARGDHAHPTTPYAARAHSLGSYALPWSLVYVSSGSGNLGILHGAACYTTAADGWKIRSCDTAGNLSTTVVPLTCGTLYCGQANTREILPSINNTFDIGSSSMKWKNIWAYNNVIQTSDARDKADIEASDLGIDFLLALRPVKFKWRALDATRLQSGEDVAGGDDGLAGQGGEGDQAGLDGQGDEGGADGLDGLDGLASQAGEVGADGMAPKGGVSDKDGAPRPAPPHTPPGVRWHHGLLAQEVKATLGDRDFAGYIYDPPTDTHGLRYSEFIAPLIKALQEEHAARLEVERRLTALEALVRFNHQ